MCSFTIVSQGENRKSGDVYQVGDLEYCIEVSLDFQTWNLASTVVGEAGVDVEAFADIGETVQLRLPVASDHTSGIYFRVNVRRLSEAELADDPIGGVAPN